MRGEAVWACERGVFVNAGVSILTFPPLSPPAVVVAFAFLMLFAKVLRQKLRSYCYTQGF